MDDGVGVVDLDGLDDRAGVFVGLQGNEYGGHGGLSEDDAGFLDARLEGGELLADGFDAQLLPARATAVCRICQEALTNISKHGFWLLLDEEELLLPFEKFPWFRSATIDQITTVERPSPEHLYWPGLDIDLTVQSIRQPEAFPLVARL